MTDTSSSPHTGSPDLDLAALLANLPAPVAPPLPAPSSGLGLASLLANLPAPTPPPLSVRALKLPHIGQIITSPHTGTSFAVQFKIGEGFFSVVFKAVDDWDNDVAIKVLRPQGTFEQDLTAASGELDRLLTLRHDKITHVKDAFCIDGMFCIVTEYCGITVGQAIDGNNGGLTLVRGVGRCVLEALQHIHNHKMVYLDLHVDNVFIYWGRNEFDRKALPGLSYKVGDVGITKPETALTPQVTMAQWMLPPEVLNPAFGPVGRAIDIYHCGLLLLQAALGRRLKFSKEEILAGAPRELALTLPEPHRTPIEMALRRRVMYRTQTAREMWKLVQLIPS
jgi:eukaryotic-like serine/threonine-protein kinase